MEIITQFIEDYKRNLCFYETAGRIAEEILSDALSSSGIRAIVTSRAKNPNRLLAKVMNRNENRDIPYQDICEIYSDIADLTGLRVSLYFPGDRTKADQVICSLFNIAETRQFPAHTGHPSFQRRFPGYCATHYRAFLRKSILESVFKTENEQQYTDVRIEIQVASVLMHAWSEVEHDLVYKPTKGQLSEEELAILDELNGLVLTGEIALERLQKAGGNRIRNQT